MGKYLFVFAVFSISLIHCCGKKHINCVQFVFVQYLYVHKTIHMIYMCANLDSKILHLIN